MKHPYSNTKATLAMAKASFTAILRSPSAVVFSLLFPLIFILVFGFIGGSGVRVDVGLSSTTDTLNPIYSALKNMEVVKLVRQSEKVMKADLEKGRIDAFVHITKSNQGLPAYQINVQYTAASAEKGRIFKSILSNILASMNSQTKGPPVAELRETTIAGRKYKTIDFILPGQLGFSLLSSGVFGTAFIFLNLRTTLVIKRFFATPVKRSSIVLGEAISRIVFGLLGALIITLVGHWLFGFTLVKGVVTVINMLVLSALGLVVFMGFGFIVSGIAKNESTVPPIANIITLPQFLLSGTFFTIDAFPAWLQPVSRALPLTYLNDAMRQVAFEGAGLMDVSKQILILFLWGIVVYSVAVKTFKWE